MKDRSASFSLAARLRSLVFAMRGLRQLVREEHNARVHLVVSVGVVGVGLMIDLSASNWCWIVLAIALVWLAEAFNTALEDLCDLVEPGFNPAIGRIKDMAAGAVLCASIAAGLIGMLILGPALWRALGI